MKAAVAMVFGVALGILSTVGAGLLLRYGPDEVVIAALGDRSVMMNMTIERGCILAKSARNGVFVRDDFISGAIGCDSALTIGQ